jgi:aminoglycoside phosphotransferase (APT) family kinase protein
VSAADRTVQGLEKFLSERWSASVKVENLSLASAGARRRNVLFDARRGDEVVPLVATIIPVSGMQIMPIEVEAASIDLAHRHGVPSPAVHGVSSDASYVGGPFFLTSRVEGETIPRRILRLVESTPGLGATLGRQCGEAMAKLHAIDTTLVHEALRKAASGASPVELALRSIEQQLATLLQPSPAFSLAGNWLARHRPERVRVAFTHCDFRNGNMIVGPDGLRAALDWEVARLSDPMEDLAWLCVRMWRFRNDQLEVGGFASRADVRAGYEAAGGRWDEASFHWWKVYCTLRWGLGLARQAMQHLDGSVPSIVMAGSGRRVSELEYDTLMLLRGAYACTR